MLVLRYDGDITRSPEFKLRGKATIEVITRVGYVAADDPYSWISEEEVIASMLDDEDVQGDASLARNKIMYSEDLIRQDRQESTIELHPGASFTYGYRRPDEEGYSIFGIAVEWHEDHWEVAVTTGGRDCDGEHARTEGYIVGPDGHEIERGVEVHDQYAEMAGF